MLRWIKDLTELRTPTPERQAEKALTDLRMELFHAELRLLEAEMVVELHRARLAFLETVVSRKGIEPRAEPPPMRIRETPMRAAPKLDTAR
jgi:hypothetical protein